MITELALATMMVLATVMLHTLGLLLLGRLTLIEAREESEAGISPLSVRGVGMIMLVVISLFVLHGSEIWLYAALYLSLSAVNGLREAVYFSTQAYAAIGFGDDAIAPEWKLIAAIEGINGIILIGWSTAFFVTVIGRLARR